MANMGSGNFQKDETRMAIESVFKKMSGAEKVRLMKVLEPLETYWCFKKLGVNSKVELIGKLGIWMVKHGQPGKS